MTAELIEIVQYVISTSVSLFWSPVLCLRVLQYHHDHLVSGHFCINKTLVLIHRDYVWPNLCSSVTDYCRSCTTCSHSKSKCHKPYGLLQQLPVPVHPWDSISMDFIEQLLPSSNSFTAILVVVDRFTKQSIFIPTHDTITSAQLEELFVIHVFSKHGVPCHVTSDRGSEFISHFFRSLGKTLDIKLYFTSGYCYNSISTCTISFFFPYYYFWNNMPQTHVLSIFIILHT